MNANAQSQEVLVWDERPAPVASETAGYMALIERAVMDPAFDLNRLERLIQLKDAAIAEAARRSFNIAMVEAQGEMRPVVKNAENTHTNSKYSTLDAIGEAIDPIITKHGFAQMFSEGVAPAGFNRIICRTLHRDGHEKVDELNVPTDSAGAKGGTNKTATHALGSTVTYGRRYLTMMIFNVKSKLAMRDDDGNAAGGREPPELIDSDQYKQLLDRIKAVNADTPGFLAYFKIQALADLPAKRFKEAMATLTQKGSTS